MTAALMHVVFVGAVTFRIRILSLDNAPEAHVSCEVAPSPIVNAFAKSAELRALAAALTETADRLDGA